MCKAAVTTEGIKLMNHTTRIWERVVQARLSRELIITEQQIWFYIMKEHNRCNICFESVDREVKSRSFTAFLLL